MASMVGFDDVLVNPDDADDANSVNILANPVSILANPVNILVNSVDTFWPILSTFWSILSTHIGQSWRRWEVKMQ